MANGVLTPKQEKFVRNLVQGMSQREAYKASYNAVNMKDGTIDKRASELFNKREIKGRYDELLQKLEDKSIMNAKDRMMFLTRIINGTETETKTYWEDGEGHTEESTADLNTKMKALDILNKMSGEYKTILGGNVEVTKKLEDLL